MKTCMPPITAGGAPTRRLRPLLGGLGLLLLGWGSTAPAGATGGFFNSTSGPIVVRNGETLEVFGSANITSNGIDPAIGVLSGGKLIIYGGTVYGQYVGVMVQGGTVDIRGGSVTSGGDGIYVYSGSATVSGGTISGTSAVSVDSSGTATISGGRISGSAFGVVAASGSATIAGCNLVLSNRHLTGSLRNGGTIDTDVVGNIIFDPAAPLITTHPSSQTVCPNNSVSFTAAATGMLTGVATVQWQVSSDGGWSFSNIPGATGTTLPITPVAADNGKLYRAVFTDGCNPSTTTAALLTVDTTLPTISCPENLSVPADTADGARLAFQVDANAGSCGSVTTVCQVDGQVISSPHTFPVGDTTVNCTATDTAGNTTGCSFTVTVVPNADLSVNVSANANSVVTGSNLTYAITVQNAGPQPAERVVLADPLPAGASFVSASPTVGTVTTSKGKNSTVSWNVGTLASGQSATLTLVVKVGAKGGTTLTNAASVSSSSPQDPNLANNSVSLPTQVLPRR